MLKKIVYSSRRLLQMAVSSLLGALVIVIIVAVVVLNDRPDLSVWHTTILDQEFDKDSEVETFEQYLELEDRLFKQLDQEVYAKIRVEDRRKLNRFNSGSLTDPQRWPTNWNRSFVLPVSDPKIAVLLLHGMSDSPYSMRSIGQLLHKRGAYVIGLRIPGHGQAPSGLLDVDWQDMAAAVRLAITELRERSGQQPLYIVGYSNGGALAVQYALNSLQDSMLPAVDGLILLSPEIGVASLAALAKWQERLGHLLGLEKLAWNALLPEYDPWKYGSFALNAGKQAYLITREIQRQITEQSKAGNLARMPPILAFQSVVDATVTAPALINNLFDRLPTIALEEKDQSARINELVLFDINRFAEIEPLMVQNPSAWIEPMLKQVTSKYKSTILSNRNSPDQDIEAISREPGSSSVEICETGMTWPESVYSLSHVALPFPPDDPVYGGELAAPGPGIALGNLALRGERKVLQVPAADMLRLRYNPFFDYLEYRLLVFMGLENPSDVFCKDQK